ncbi:MAG TPA: GNAT family N-acetyltransferase [Vicinamibacteria bacterium]|nr:GNAT family N-acetyltransferase [Vicinamibacteria bacterium]
MREAIREATVQDLETILHHRRRMCEDMGHRDSAVLEAMVADGRGLLRRWLEEGVYRGWLAERDGVVVAGGGIIVSTWLPNAADPQDRRATILNVYTEPAHRRQGLARALMEVMVGWCRAQGFRAVTLDASDDGRALYESMGFLPTPQLRLDLSR